MQHRKKTGGRLKGTPNKITGGLKQKIKEVVELEMSNFDEYLDELPPDKKIEYTLKLLSYVVPKPTTFESIEDNKIEVVFVKGKTIL